MQKIAIISHQSLKKGHLEGKNIPPGQIPLYMSKCGNLYFVEAVQTYLWVGTL